MQKLKNDIAEILDFLKERGHGRRRIENKLGYSAKYIDQILSRGGSKDLLTLLEFYKEYAILHEAINETNRNPIDDSTIAEEIKINFDRLSSAIGQLTGIKRERILPSSQPYPLDKIRAFYNLRRGDKMKGAGK